MFACATYLIVSVRSCKLDTNRQALIRQLNAGYGESSKESNRCIGDVLADKRLQENENVTLQ